jgi:8-oxo-dGTP diphosphatase
MPTPQPIAVAIVHQADQVLIGRRASDVPLAGFWEFPGGKVLADETPEEAAVRECCEETGLDVRIEQKCLTVTHSYSHGLVELHFFIAVPTNPHQTPMAPFRWVPMADLPGYTFPPANATVIARLMGNGL